MTHPSMLSVEVDDIRCVNCGAVTGDMTLCQSGWVHDEAETCTSNEIRRLTNERDRAWRLFNRLEAAVSHHKKVTDQLFADTHDEALYAARDRVLRDSAERTT